MKDEGIMFRSLLLRTFTEKKYSQSAKHEIMLLFGNIEPEKKEEIAKQLIPLVETGNSEEEAMRRVTEALA